MGFEASPSLCVSPYLFTHLQRRLLSWSAYGGGGIHNFLYFIHQISVFYSTMFVSVAKRLQGCQPWYCSTHYYYQILQASTEILWAGTALSLCSTAVLAVLHYYPPFQQYYRQLFLQCYSVVLQNYPSVLQCYSAVLQYYPSLLQCYSAELQNF